MSTQTNTAIRRRTATVLDWVSYLRNAVPDRHRHLRLDILPRSQTQTRRSVLVGTTQEACTAGDERLHTRGRSLRTGGPHGDEQVPLRLPPHVRCRQHSERTLYVHGCGTSVEILRMVLRVSSAACRAPCTILEPSIDPGAREGASWPDGPATSLTCVHAAEVSGCVVRMTLPVQPFPLTVYVRTLREHRGQPSFSFAIRSRPDF